MNKKKIIKEQASFDEQTERQMAERVLNFLSALKSPAKKIGEKRAQRKANPDFVAPEPEHVARFEQKNRADRWSQTVYGEGDYGSVQAKITVQDPQDPDDIVLDPITPESPTRTRVKGDEELRDAPGEKISSLLVDADVDEEDSTGINPRTS